MSSFPLPHAYDVPSILFVLPYYTPKRAKFKNALVRMSVVTNNFNYFTFQATLTDARVFYTNTTDSILTACR